MIPEEERGALEYRSTIRNQIIAIIVVLLLVPLIISTSRYKVLSPFALHDHQFLVFFPLLAISCLLSYMLLEFEKYRALEPLLKAAFPVKASIFQITYFLEKNSAVQTAVVDLVRRKLLEVTTDKLFLVHKQRYVQLIDEQNPLIPALLKEERACVCYDRIVHMWYDRTSMQHPVLHPVQLMAKRGRMFLISVCLLLIPFVIGIARFILWKEKDVSPDALFWELVLLSVTSWLLMKYFTHGGLVRWKAKQLVNGQRETQVLYPDYIVSRFALEGKAAIERFSDGLALIEIFNLGPLIYKISDKAWLFYNASEEEKGVIWSNDGKGWQYYNNPERLMKEMENKCLR